MGWLRMPLLPLALAFAAGIAAVDHVAAPWSLWALSGATLATAALAIVLRRVRLAATLLFLGVAALGALRALPVPLPPHHVARLPLPQPALVTGRIAAEPTRFAAERTRLALDVEEVDGITRTGRLQANVYGLAPPLGEGQRIRAEIRLSRPSGFRNPGGFDYAVHLARQGTLVVGNARADRLTVVDDPGLPWHARLKQRAREAIAAALPPASAALLMGLLLGERAGLPADIDGGFRRAGVYHLLAVSGFNVALVAGATFALLSLLRFPRRGAAAGAIIVVLGFAAIVGPQPSVLRAAIMGVLLLGALLVDRDAAALNSLALAALVILALRPCDLHDPGFQLSFAATAGILLAPLPRTMIAGAIAVSLAAELAVLPITLAHFNQLSLIGPLTNLGAVPLAGLTTIVGLLGVAASWVAAAGGEVLLNATWPVLIALRAVVAVAAAPSWAMVHLPAPAWPAVVCYVGALGVGLVAWRVRGERPRVARGVAGLALALAGLAAAMAAWPLVRPLDGKLRVIVLDVGQGDAIVVETPGGPRLLIDAGSGGPLQLDVGEHVVAPLLWNRGTLRLAGAVTTHDDQDHAGGMGAIRRLFPVAASWTAEDLRSGPRVVGGVRLTALPRIDARGGRRGRNDDALALRIDYGLASFLLASDITAATEADLVAAGAPLAATVLKVAHHGSRGSSTPQFLQAVRPLVAVVSVGGRNPYGHPSPETLGRLAAVGAAAYRTDRDGAIVLETDGRQLSVTRWASRQTDRYCLDPETVC